MRFSFVIIAGPSRRPWPGGITPPRLLPEQLDSMQPLLYGISDAFGGIEAWQANPHNVNFAGSYYPGDRWFGTDREPWIDLVEEHRASDYLSDKEASVKRIGRPLSLGETLCAATHRSALIRIFDFDRAMAANPNGLSFWEHYPVAFQHASLSFSNFYSAGHLASATPSDRIWVILEDDAVPLWTLSRLESYCREMIRMGKNCSLLHGGDADRAKKGKGGEIRTPVPKTNEKRYGTFSMAFTPQGIIECLNLHARDNGKVIVPVDNLYMESGLFAVPDIPMFVHDNEAVSSLATERSDLQRRARQGEFRTHGQTDPAKTGRNRFRRGLHR